ncbi:hypothetical protein Ddc_20163 [Ditylenchus destructor]|nr:hypothetical protein Ddc_20163 [Ditylenchus destructor]
MAIVIGVYRFTAAEGMTPAVRLVASSDSGKSAPTVELPPAAAPAVASRPAARAPSPRALRAEVRSSCVAAGRGHDEFRSLCRSYELRDMKSLGTYAVAFENHERCGEAYREVQFTQEGPPAAWLPAGQKWVDPVAVEPSPELRARRESARQEVIARCQPFRDSRSQLTPMDDDRMGWHYANALIHATRADAEAKPEGVPAAMAAQGLAWASTEVLRRESAGFAFFDGERLGGLSEVEFNQAMWRAEALVTSSAEKSDRKDLRVLQRCAVTGNCLDSWVDVQGGSRRDPDAYARVNALAERMAAALRSGDV